HPTQKPEALLYRTIVAATDVGQTVLDPFFGSGTTGAVAKKLGRRFVGIERDPHYADIAKERIAKVRRISDEDALKIESKKDQPRIPFGWLVERGMLQPGQVLTDQRRRHAARVRADGTLTTGEFRGSIHQVGAFVQRAPACNGWQFWYVERKGELVPIDIYRQKLRAELH
ncbi:MAG: DNA methyltransferase, partial [Rhodospirillaceae bacterium]